MSLAKERVSKGLCPRCGKEAAPYYLCPEHRQSDSLARQMKRLENHGFCYSVKKGRDLWWTGNKAMDNVKPQDVMRCPPVPVWGEGKGQEDGRLRPRMRGIPTDVEATLIELFKHEKQGLTTEEVIEAWGRLRVRPGRDSAAADMKHIIIAARRRKDRASKRKQKSPPQNGGLD